MVDQVLHDRLCIKAARWFRSRMSKHRWAREVNLDDNYRADVVGIGRISGSSGYKKFAPHLYDEDYTYRSSYDSKRTIKAHVTKKRFLWVFEIKRTRSDYLNMFPKDRDSNRFDPQGNLHFVVTDSDQVCPTNEGPGFWGLLRTSGPGLTLCDNPDFMNKGDRETIVEIGYRLLWKIPPKGQRLKRWESMLDRRETLGRSNYRKI